MADYTSHELLSDFWTFGKYGESEIRDDIKGACGKTPPENSLDLLEGLTDEEVHKVVLYVARRQFGPVGPERLYEKLRQHVWPRA